MSQTAPMTITGLKIDRFKRIRAVNLRPDKTGLVELHGKNGQGKSSVLDAIEHALAGGRSPAQPVFNGEGRADIRVDLGDLHVWVRWTDPDDLSKRMLTVENATGGKLETPQAVLDALASKMVDPTRFLLESEPEQVRQVLGLVELGVDLDASKREENAIEQDRLAARRNVTKLTGQVAELEAAAAEAPSERVDMASLTAELQAAVDHNRIHDETETRRKEALSDFHAKTAELEKKKTDHAELLEQIRQLQETAERIQSEDIPTLQSELEAIKANGQAIRAELEDLGPVRDTAPIQKRIETAQKSAAAYSAADRLADRKKQLDEANAEFKGYEAKLEELRAARRDALQRAEFPVDGLGFDPEHGSSGRLTWKGSPFSQASQAERLRIAAELVMRKDAKIRVLICREGSFLDSESLAILGEVADRHGWQVWVEIVDDAPTGVGLWIEDGQASGEGAE